MILNLYNKPPVIEIAEELMGEGNVLPVVSAKPYPRFPLAPGEDAPEPRGHINGIGNGSNGMAKGEYRRGFTAFAVIYLADLLETNAGNFIVWPQSHRAYEDYFKKVGHEVLAEGMPRIDVPADPVMVTGRAGDLILAHHQILHAGGQTRRRTCATQSSPAYVTKMSATSSMAAYADIWREWPGISEAVLGQTGAG